MQHEPDGALGFDAIYVAADRLSTRAKYGLHNMMAHGARFDGPICPCMVAKRTDVSYYPNMGKVTVQNINAWLSLFGLDPIGPPALTGADLTIEPIHSALRKTLVFDRNTRI